MNIAPTIANAPALPIRRREIDTVKLKASWARVTRNLLATYCLIGILGYAPAVDSHGNCHCPICDPFTLATSSSR